MSTGMKRGTVYLEPHQTEWERAAEETIRTLKSIIGSTAAEEYEAVKLRLAKQYPDDRIAYTDGKQEVIDRLLAEARVWKSKQLSE